MNQTTLIGTEIEMIDDDHIDGLSDDDDDEGPSSPESAYDGDLMHIDDEVTAQLAAAGPVGVAAAAAIASAKKRKRPHSFETNPSIRKRQQNRLLRKLRQTIYEFATRVGQQAVVLVATPGKPNTSYKVFGAKPLEDVVRNLKSIVMEELESALAQQAPPPVQEDPSLFELPPLIIDGIPTPVEKMTQAQLRAFIPLMLKYSTGRGKPGWGRESTRPPWWPKELPWANVRMDARTEDEKQKPQRSPYIHINMTDVSEWYKKLPIFTKYWLSLTVGISLLARFNILYGEWLYLDPYFVYYKFNFWRIVTCVFYYPLNPSTGFHFLLNCYFLYNYSLRLETDHFKSSPGDYLFLLLFNWVCCVIIGLLFSLPLLMDPMVLSVLYIWCQLNKDVIVNFWFGTRFKAMYLPWVLLTFNLILSSGSTYSLVGILVGHLYFFLKIKYPQELGGPSYLNTPTIIKSYFPDVRGGVHGFGVAPQNQRPIGDGNNQNRMFGGHAWGRGHTLGRD